ncbi:chemotaxis protein CheW [Oxalobacteraceae bacterium OM1]|nr:chemotaxis protein CheW [Oxalobacteraceae bacterium OM1]
MQFLLFQIGNDRYGLRTERIVRVVPLVELKALPQAPAWVAGLMNYRGVPVPVVDLSQRATGQPAQPWFSTRIVLVHIDAGLLGLIVERTGTTERIAEASWQPPHVAQPDAPYLGKVSVGGDIVQLVEPDHLLPPDVRALLYPDAAEARC